jgi:sulfate permease, SulP family
MNDDISLLSFREEIKGYSWPIFRQDALAALSVALLTLPQAIAYAMLAGLPLTAGLFASVYSSIFAAFFGSSRHLIVGPSNAIAILIQSATAEVLFAHYHFLEGVEREMMALQILTQLALLVGVMQIMAAVFKLGRLTQFVSHSVVVGYMAGTALAVMVNQLFTFFGVPNMQGDHSLYSKGVYLITHLFEMHWPTALIGAGSLLLLLLCKRLDKRIPAPVITLILAAGVVHLMSLFPFSLEGMGVQAASISWESIALVGNKGHIHELWPRVSLPFFDLALLNHLLPFAFAIGLLSVMETISVGKTIAASSGQRLSVNQEIFGLGLGNCISSLISAMPVSGSPSRSSLNYALGSKTRCAALFNALFVALILFCFSFLIMHVPMAALSALLLVTAVGIVRPHQFFLCLKATNSDALVLWLTVLACVFLSLDVAFYIGIALSVTFYLKKAAIPQLVEYEIDEHGELKNLDAASRQQKREIRVIKVEGELFFGAADLFQHTLKTIAEDDSSTRVIILQLKNARDIDATVCLALHHLHAYLQKSKRYLIACGMTKQIWNVLSDSGMVELIGKENLFMFDKRHPHLHMQKALQRAQALAHSFHTMTTEAESKQLTPQQAQVGAGPTMKKPSTPR